MPLKTPRRVSVSTWSLHPLLGTCAPGRPGDPDARMMGDNPGTLDLLDVPAALKEHGVETMELCHFHVPTRDPAYLAELRARREAAGVELWSLLIDDGDINDPEQGDRDRAWTLGWIDTAAALGARCVRVIGGKQEPTPATMNAIADLMAWAVKEFDVPLENIGGHYNYADCLMRRSGSNDTLALCRWVRPYPNFFSSVPQLALIERGGLCLIQPVSYPPLEIRNGFGSFHDRPGAKMLMLEFRADR